MCIYPPQSLAGSHLWVCRCQLSHSQHSPMPDFVPCPFRTALLKLTSLGLKIWCWHCPCICDLCSSFEHMETLLRVIDSRVFPLMLDTHICFVPHGLSWHYFKTNFTDWVFSCPSSLRAATSIEIPIFHQRGYFYLY